VLGAAPPVLGAVPPVLGAVPPVLGALPPVVGAIPPVVVVLPPVLDPVPPVLVVPGVVGEEQDQLRSPAGTSQAEAESRAKRRKRLLEIKVLTPQLR
jgi:hypothetical protein